MSGDVFLTAGTALDIVVGGCPFWHIPVFPTAAAAVLCLSRSPIIPLSLLVAAETDFTGLAAAVISGGGGGDSPAMNAMYGSTRERISCTPRKR
jgi:hypothetical protein